MEHLIGIVALAIVSRVWTQDDSYIQTVCQRVRTVDNSIVSHIKSLVTTDRNDFLNEMREYVQAIRSFQSCLEQDKESTVTLAQDIIEEEGPKFYYHYDPEFIQDVLNYNEAEMDECNQLQKQAVDTWIEIDKLLTTWKLLKL